MGVLKLIVYHQTIVSAINVYQNGVQKSEKAQNILWFGPYDFVQIFHKHVVNIYLRNAWKVFRHPMSDLATVTVKRFDGKFTAKKLFSDWVLYATIADAEIGSQNISIH